MKKLKKLSASYWDILTIAFIVIYVVAAILVSLNRYWQFDAFWYELGLYNTAIFKVAHLQAPIIEQFNNRLIFADHFNPSLFLFSWVYWFTDKTEAILIAQAVVVGASAWVAHLIGKKLIKENVVVFSLVVSYLGFVGMQNALYTDFHDTTVATLFVALTFWAIFSKKWNLYFLFLLITLGFKENMAGFGAGIGLFLMLKRDKQIKLALITIAVSVFYYIVVTRLVIPYFSGGSFNYNPVFVSNNPVDVILSFFVPISLKARTIFLSLLTFGMAPLFSPAIWPILIEHYTERFVMSQAATRWDLGFHYNPILSPILFVGSIPFYLFLIKRNIYITRAWAIATILTVIFLHRFYLHGPLLLAHHPVFYDQTKRAKFMSDFFEAIPKDNGLVMTQNNIAAHLGTKKVVLLNLSGFDEINPSVVAVDLRQGQNANNFFPATYDDAKSLATMLSLRPDYTLSGYNSNQLIYVKKMKSNSI